MSDVDDVKSGTTVAYVISDIDGLPVSVDNNPAHFSGLIFAIGDWAQRTGNFLPLLTDGVVVSGSKTIVDSVSAVPFLRGMVTGARVYTPTDPCPPTAARIAAHNASARAAGTGPRWGASAVAPRRRVRRNRRRKSGPPPPRHRPRRRRQWSGMTWRRRSRRLPRRSFAG